MAVLLIVAVQDVHRLSHFGQQLQDLLVFLYTCVETFDVKDIAAVEHLVKCVGLLGLEETYVFLVVADVNRQHELFSVERTDLRRVFLDRFDVRFRHFEERDAPDQLLYLRQICRVLQVRMLDDVQ